MRYLPILFTALLFCCCKHNDSDNQLIVSVEKISLRASPGVTSAETTVLRQGEKLTDLGEVSHFESEITFGDQALRTPWLKVKTSGNKQGWIFAGAVKPAENMEAWLLQKRLDCYFGHAFASRLNTCKASLDDIQTDAQFAAVYRLSTAMRDSMVHELERRPEPNGRPEYRWLPEALPGFIYQRAYEGGPPRLFADYRFWGQKAQKTSGAADDAFLETCYVVFPRDSIESFFPVWKFQFSELESASNLGTGAHLKVLQQIEKNLAQSRVFEPELMQIKDAVLEDIQDKYTRFWQSKDLILSDLDKIIANPPTYLSANESSALQLRRVMLEDPEKNGIRVNLRSGE